MSENNANVGINELLAQAFARAFIMPQNLFEEVFLENSKTIYDENDEESLAVDFESIAKKFGVDEILVIARARELGLIP